MERGGSLDNGDLRMYTKTVGNTPTGEAKLHDYSFWKGSAHRDGKVQHQEEEKKTGSERTPVTSSTDCFELRGPLFGGGWCRGLGLRAYDLSIDLQCGPAVVMGEGAM